MSRKITFEESVRALLLSEENKMEVDEALGTALPIGNTKLQKKKTTFSKTSLSGPAMRGRALKQSRGNQTGQNRYESFDLMQEATQKAFEKIKNKKEENENPSGKTDTGQRPDPVNFAPTKQDLQQHIRDSNINK